MRLQCFVTHILSLVYSPLEGRSVSPFQSQPGSSFSIQCQCSMNQTVDQLNCRPPCRSQHHSETLPFSHDFCSEEKCISCMLRRESWRGLVVPEFLQSDGHVLPVSFPLSSLHTYPSGYSALFCTVIGS